MGAWEYAARDQAGRPLAGVLDAETEAAAVRALHERGLIVTALRPRREAAGADLLAPLRGVRLGDLAVATRQLAAMVGAGLPIRRALAVLEEQTERPALRDVVRSVRAEVEAGSALSAALAAHPRVFSHLYVSMVRAGEAAGALDDVLARLAAALERELALRHKIRSATTYPILLACAALAALLFMTVVVIPQFAAFYTSLAGSLTLPLPTRIAIGVSAAIRRFWWLWTALAAGAAAGLRRFLRTPAGREWYGRAVLRAPLLGPIARKIVVTRFSRTLGTLVSSGVPILRALEVTAQAVDNAVVARALAAVRGSVREGESIAAPLGGSGVFPAMVVHMVRVGEETGALDSLLAKIADFYEAEVDAAVASLASILEPALIIGMGAVIGALLVALYLPIFMLAQAIK
jgi:type IV pilus assembly protein PilC